jgi:RNA polymerase sigma-70 factor (ECF subfamily)
MLFSTIGEVELGQISAKEASDTNLTVGVLYEKYYDRIVRYIFVRIGDQSEAENLAGDVFLKALKSFDSFHGNGEQIRSWLFKIAHNLMVDYVRKASKQKFILFNDIEIPDKSSIEETVEKKFEVEKLSKALKQLTPAQREVIGLRYFAGLSSDEVGKILGKSSGSVRQMQWAAVEALRKQMHIWDAISACCRVKAIAISTERYG